MILSLDSLGVEGRVGEAKGETESGEGDVWEWIDGCIEGEATLLVMA
jgi:hypothetical protein